MAAVPCEIHGARFLGAARYLYPALMLGSRIIRDRYRACPECAQRVFAWFEAVSEEVVPGQFDQVDQAHCALCDDELVDGEVRHFFMTAYPAQDSRVDWHVLLCEGCGLTEGERIQNRHWT